MLTTYSLGRQPCLNDHGRIWTWISAGQESLPWNVGKWMIPFQICFNEAKTKTNLNFNPALSWISRYPIKLLLSARLDEGRTMYVRTYVRNTMSVSARLKLAVPSGTYYRGRFWTSEMVKGSVNSAIGEEEWNFFRKKAWMNALGVRSRWQRERGLIGREKREGKWDAAGNG